MCSVLTASSLSAKPHTTMIKRNPCRFDRDSFFYKLLRLFRFKSLHTACNGVEPQMSGVVLVEKFATKQLYITKLRCWLFGSHNAVDALEKRDTHTTRYIDIDTGFINFLLGFGSGLLVYGRYGIQVFNADIERCTREVVGINQTIDLRKAEQQLTLEGTVRTDNERVFGSITFIGTLKETGQPSTQPSWQCCLLTGFPDSSAVGD